MEVGRSSVTGAGELWMVTEDNHIAQHMHSAIMSAMTKGIKNLGATPPTNDSEIDLLGPKPRTRSSSATEASKPILMQQRRQTHGNGECILILRLKESFFFVSLNSLFWGFICIYKFVLAFLSKILI